MGSAKAPPRPPRIGDVMQLLQQAAQLRALVAQGAQIQRAGPGGIMTKMTPAEAVDEAQRLDGAAQQLFERLVGDVALQVAGSIAGQLAIGDLVATRKPDGCVHVGPPAPPPESLS